MITNIKQMKYYQVPIRMEVLMDFEGATPIYAESESNAVEKVHFQLTSGILDDLKMRDRELGDTQLLGDLRSLDEVSFEIETDMIELFSGEIDAMDLLHAEIDELNVRIPWNSDRLRKQKAFLQSIEKEASL